MTFSGKTVLVTGGTGSFGKKFVQHLLENHSDIRKVIVFSRDELKQFEMSNQDPFRNYGEKLRFFIGDVRDLPRLTMALKEVDIVVHAAALKQVPTAEYNPFECIKTNILGAQNVIEASLASPVQRVVALSTDKAVSPINLYGATKLCSDKLFIAANNIRGKKDIRFSVVRYGNVFGSRGSVVPYFLEKAKAKVLPVTDERMTRFNILLQEGVALVVQAIQNASGGEIFVPKIPSYRITDLVKAIDQDCKIEIVGVRPGEKIHEEMISNTDSFNTYDFGSYFVIYPMEQGFAGITYNREGGKKVAEGFRYASDLNTDWLSVDDLKGLIQKNLQGTL
ncbi:MAG: UDP-N-acetylglucosamine 4,6-dehydratase (inverting) [Bdellovibrionales bacterium]|nr:UDP-N-acetylglucosamine 4,6-dehydratase (inverting) [Bdellovibrionales bacterium]